jgi:hypothetical protein
VDGIRISRGIDTRDIPSVVAILMDAFSEKIAHELRPVSTDQLVRLVTSGISRAHGSPRPRVVRRSVSPVSARRDDRSSTSPSPSCAASSAGWVLSLAGPTR